MALRRGDGTARLAEGARAEGERLRERHARLVRERGTPVCLVMREGNEADDAPYAMMGGTGAVLYAEGEAAPEDETADTWGGCDVLFADGNVEEAVPPNRIAPIAAGTPTPPTRMPATRAADRRTMDKAPIGRECSGRAAGTALA